MILLNSGEERGSRPASYLLPETLSFNECDKADGDAASGFELPDMQPLPNGATRDRGAGDRDVVGGVTEHALIGATTFGAADSDSRSGENANDCGVPGPIDRYLQLADGRTISYREIGTRDGRPVMALHGTPGSRFKYCGAHEAAAQRDLRLISLDRWGYGGSSPHPAGTLARFSDDAEEIANRLGLGRFGVVGVSGGGPFAVSVAAGLGERVDALALVAPVGQLVGGWPVRDLRLFHWNCFCVMPRVPGAVRVTFEIYRALLAVAPRTAVMIASARAKGADRALVADPDVRRSLAKTFAAGLAPGVAGAIQDMRLFSRTWDVDPATITAPTRMWLGTDDCNVPISAARNLARSIPGSETIELAGQGHFWISKNYEDVLGWLANAA